MVQTDQLYTGRRLGIERHVHYYLLGEVSRAIGQHASDSRSSSDSCYAAEVLKRPPCFQLCILASIINTQQVLPLANLAF